MLIAPHNLSVAALISGNLQRVRAEVARAAEAARRTVESITVIAVSKGHAAEQVRAAADCGVRDFAESYLQEASPKLESLRDLAAIWHFIGRVQANKTREIAERFDWVHGIDRIKIAERLSAQRPHYAPPLQVCLQVNIGSEIAKAGIEPAKSKPQPVAISGFTPIRSDILATKTTAIDAKVIASRIITNAASAGIRTIAFR